ncbi:TetR/AcrR family transcriptional regulator [Telmatospirillum sp.]|uniref:TetR/AcrR family transcriptional regulator n=1 Tax=Telmatospirillum sp. TaxID=2079197 RepID=UPI00284F2E1F|nr:TetR/AcrR family transcriptional regulator [Telmatospirillum sp.]MDR3438474.1 TetR/AcrR family transcriptional regulator [Telmatospirillum sp.]
MAGTAPEGIGHAGAIVDAALALASEKGWHGVSLADIAARADLSLAELHAECDSKSAILKAFFQRLDDALWSGDLPQAEETPRDRLFDVVMRRFDALQPHRAGVQAILTGLASDPWLLLSSGPHLLKTTALMLEVSGISASGPAGRLKVHGLSAIYLAVLRVWLSDDSADMGKTMAALDRFLRGAESIAGLAWRRRGASSIGGGSSGDGHA